jgi:hypothetical protein
MMTDDLVLREAVRIAWSMYLATHSDVDIADQRLCSMSRYLSERQARHMRALPLQFLQRAIGFLTNCRWTVGDFPLRDDVFSGMSLPGSAKCGKKDFGDLIAQSAAQAGIERALEET